eukprot:g345.t1
MLAYPPRVLHHRLVCKADLFGRVELSPDTKVHDKGALDKGKFIKINSMLVKVANSVLSSEDMTKSGKRMIQRYENLLHKSDVNLVNCVTMLHRLGLVLSSSNHHDELLNESMELLKELIWLLCKFAHDLDPRQMSNVVWSLGKFNRSIFAIRKNEFSVPELYSIIFRRSLEFACFKPQEISSYLVGLANVKLRRESCEAIVEHLVELAIENVHRMKSQELSNILWSLATLEYTSSGGYMFVNQALDQMIMKFAKFSPQNVTNVVWALSKMKMQKAAVGILPYVEHDLTNRVKAYSTQGITLVLWAFAKLKYLPEIHTLDGASNWTIANLDTLSCQSIAHLVYAFAIFGYRPKETGYQNRLKQVVISRKQEFSPQLLCMILWSQAIAFQLDIELLTSLLKQIETTDWRTVISDSDRRQLYQCVLHVQSFLSEEVHGLDSELIEQCRRDWEKGQLTKWTDSVSLSVLTTLESLGCVIQHQYLASTGSSHLMIDSVMGLERGKRIAIEVTIPKHQFRNDPDRIEGTRIWMWKLLTRNGYSVLQIDAQKWRKMSAIERKTLLKRKLKVQT